MKILPYVALGLFLVACTQVPPPAENTRAVNGAVVKDAANSTGAGNAVKNPAPSEISATKNRASANAAAKNSTASSMREIWKLLENADRALLAKEISRAEELAARAQELSELKRIEVGRIFSRFVRARIALQRGDTDAAISLATDASSMQSGVAEIYADAVNYESAYTFGRIYEARGDRKGAVREYGRALFVWTMFLQSDPVRAEEIFARLQTLTPDPYEAEGRASGACEYLRAKAGSALNEPAPEPKRRALRDLAEWEARCLHLRPFIEDGSDERARRASLARDYAQLYAGLGECAAALEHLLAAAELSDATEPDTGGLYLQIARQFLAIYKEAGASKISASYAQKNLAAAQDYANRSVKLYEGMRGTAYEHSGYDGHEILGEIAMIRGDPSAALRHFAAMRDDAAALLAYQQLPAYKQALAHALELLAQCYDALKDSKNKAAVLRELRRLKKG